jgi:hypothetical protein
VLKNKIEDLDQLRTSGHGSKIRFTDIDLIASEKVLNFGEPIQYRLKIRSKQSFDRLSIGSSIFNSSGNCVGTLIGPEFSIDKNESLELKLTISNANLAPDSYPAGFSIGFGQEEGTRKDLDIVVGKPAFEIVSAKADSFVSNWHPNWGSLVLTCTDFQVRTDLGLHNLI